LSLNAVVHEPSCRTRVNLTPHTKSSISAAPNRRPTVCAHVPPI
jgi:hypothetical protein